MWLKMAPDNDTIGKNLYIQNIYNKRNDLDKVLQGRKCIGI